MRPNLHRAAQAIADYFNTIEAERGEPIKDVFNNQLIDGKPTVNVIGVPVPMLRTLITALQPAQPPTEADEQAIEQAVRAAITLFGVHRFARALVGDRTPVGCGDGNTYLAPERPYDKRDVRCADPAFLGAGLVLATEAPVNREPFDPYRGR